MSDNILFVSTLVLGILAFKDSRKKWYFLCIIIPFLFFQGWYGFNEKRRQDLKDSRAELTQDQMSLRQSEISSNLKELKEKDQKGTLTNAEYGLYLARYLESIDLTLKRQQWKSLREWVALYHDEVNKIPLYFNLEEWEQSEKFIYDRIIEEIVGGFASKNISNSDRRTKAFAAFQKERDRLVNAKKRTDKGM